MWVKRKSSGKIRKNKIFEKNQAERTAFSESPGRETPILKIWAQSELKNNIFGQIENFGTFCIIFMFFHYFWMMNQGCTPTFKVFGPNGRDEAISAENFGIESPVFVASRPPACSNGGTQDFLPNFSANSKFQVLSSDVSGHFLMTF